MENKDLDMTYRENLERNIISYLAQISNLEIKESMDIYYASKLSSQIEQGLYGIDNLDYKYLANDLIENEPELFRQTT